MKKSTFTKQINLAGKYGAYCAEVVATLNCESKTLVSTNRSTHEDYTKQVSTHKVEAFIDSKLWKSYTGIITEDVLLNMCEKLIDETYTEVRRRCDEPPMKTFTEKMNDLFK